MTSPSLPTLRIVPLRDMTLHDVEMVRKVLRGSSVIDWKRLNITTREAVGDFLRSAGFHPAAEGDRARLKDLHRRSVDYLRNTLGFELPADLDSPDRVSDVFLEAAGPAGARQRMACAILKVMHIFQHLDARELRHRMSASDQELFDLIEVRVDRAIHELRQAGFGIVRLIPSVKETEAIVTKLLSKPRALAAQIYDRLRFRVITRDDADIAPLLRHMCTRMFPFNYSVPEESRNDILDFRRLLREEVALAPYEAQLQDPLDDRDSLHRGHEINEFSGSQYRAISFVADVPIRVDELGLNLDGLFDRLGAITYVSVEFQVFDEHTWAANERSDASHPAYKARQRRSVLRRLVPYHDDPDGDRSAP